MYRIVSPGFSIIDPPGLVSPYVHEIVAIQLLVSNMFVVNLHRISWNDDPNFSPYMTQEHY